MCHIDSGVAKLKKEPQRNPSMEKLTDIKVKNLKPRDKEYYVREGGGFVLRIRPSGSKSFYFIYDYGQKRQRLLLGSYPSVSLAQAREKHMEAVLVLKKGGNPKLPAVEPVPQIEKLSVQELADLWFAWSEQNHSAKWSNTLQLAIKKDFLPSHGHQLVAAIRRRDAVAVLEVKASKAPGQAVNLHKALRGMWELAKEKEYVEYNPFAEIRVARAIPAMRQKSRERFLSEEEIKFLWTAIEAGGGSDSTRRALKVMLLTGQRSGEVCGMRRQEIQYGVGRPQCWQCRRCGWWTIPSVRRQGNKGGEHRVYLAPMAIEIIGSNGDVIFPGDLDDKPITANSVNHHVRRAVESTGKMPYFGLPRWTPHDLRRTCGTNIRRLGGTTKDMDLILGHTAGGVTGIYDRYEGEDEKVKWMLAWSEYISQLIR